MNRGDHDHTPDKSSDDGSTPLAFKGVPICSLVTHLAKYRIWHSTSRTQNSVQSFHVVICICFHSAGEGDQQIPPSPAHLMMDVSYLILLNLKCLFLVIIIQVQQSGRPFYGKTIITGSSTFFFFDIFQTVTVMLTRSSGKN
jgi:hypothetical protein